MSSEPPGTLTEPRTAGDPKLPAARQQGELVASKYLLERPLAEGGMGSLWVARHVELDVEVAIKFNAMERGAAHDLRFRREARAAARLKSAHIVHVFDYGIEGGEPYIAMELLEGESLRELLQREGRLSLARAAALVAHVAKGLEVAHQAGIVHRDLKPSNLFLARTGKEQVVKILDFGIAKASAEAASETSAASAQNLGGEATRVGSIVGSPAYMSPEQARGEHVDKRSDLWSLAVVTYRTLAGVEPFLGASAAETLDKICGTTLPRARGAAPDLPAELDDFFERGLARPRERRFQSAQELSDALQALAARDSETAGAGAAQNGRAEPEIGAVAAGAIGRTGETRPLEMAREPLPSTGIRKRSLRFAAGTLVVATLLTLYFWVNRGPMGDEPRTSEVEHAGGNLSRSAPALSEPRVALTPALSSPSRETALEPPAGATFPRLPPRKHTAQRASQPETRPADSSRSPEPTGGPPAEREELDPTFGLKR